MTTVEPIKELNDIRKIEDTLRQTNLRNLILFDLGINCGLRISDMLRLNVGDVKNKNYIRLTEQKTGKYKKIPLNSKIQAMLEDFTRGRKLTEPLFVSQLGNRMERVNAYIMLKKACKMAELEEHIGTHSMRKTFGYHHYRKFKDVAILQKIFNHSSPVITLRYIGIEQEQIEKSLVSFIL